jgi:uncharacterized protein
MQQPKKTLVIGASANPDRYSSLCIHRLLENNHPIVALGRNESAFGKVAIISGKPALDNIHTVTMYIGQEHQHEYYDYILQLKPNRVIFNPGAENPGFALTLENNSIEVLNGCTLVLLASGEY